MVDVWRDLVRECQLSTLMTALTGASSEARSAQPWTTTTRWASAGGIPAITKSTVNHT